MAKGEALKSRRIIFRPEANADLVLAHGWYSSVDVRAAERFEEEVERTIDYISQFPNGFQIRKPPFRFAPLRKFRFSIIYSVERDAVIVYRVRHMHQRPLKLYFGL